MYPLRTVYVLAQNARDYRVCHELLTAVGAEETAFRFPTIMAIRDKTLLGFLGTLPNKTALIAGPLVLDPTQKRPIITAIRLVECYERTLHQAGIPAYYFGIDTANASWKTTAERIGLTPYAEDDQGYWFKKQIA